MARAKQQEAERDNQTAPAPADTGEWEEVKVGLGEAWDFEKNPILMGVYLGSSVVQLNEPRSGDGATEATVYEFAKLDTGEIVFAWASHKLSQALENVGVDDRVKIEYLGKVDIKQGRQQLRQYRVWRQPAQRHIPGSRTQDFGDTNPLDEV